MEREVIPRAALILGWAGVLPFAALALATLLDLSLPFAPPGLALISYGAIILSFMGGVQWGLATAPGEIARRDDRQRFSVSVLPSLWAWLCFLVLPPAGALLGLAAGFAALLAYDLHSVRTGFASLWYRPLRIQLTVAVVALLLAALF